MSRVDPFIRPEQAASTLSPPAQEPRLGLRRLAYATLLTTIAFTGHELKATPERICVEVAAGATAGDIGDALRDHGGHLYGDSAVYHAVANTEGPIYRAAVVNRAGWLGDLMDYVAPPDVQTNADVDGSLGC